MKKSRSLKLILVIIVGLVILIGGVFLIKKLPPENIIISPTPSSTTDAIPTTLPTLVAEPQYSFDDPQWWQHAVFYEIFVRSFFDSNGDGIGDLNGIIQKLDYLNDGDPSTTSDLGINAIWLMPIFPSPSYHGYDVTDYFSVNPEYGTIEDLKKLIEEAHLRGIHVIIDFVINHTSDQHPWFVAAQDPKNSFHNWYIWSENNPGYAGPWGEKVWHEAHNGLFYYGVFSESMPDLNFVNPDVTTEMEEAARYWLVDVGVDGFRIDGARHLIEEGKIQENTKSTISWFQDFEKMYKTWKPNSMTVGEIWDSSYVTTSYLKSSSFDMVFDFDLASAIVSTVATGNADGLSANIASEVELYNYKGMGTFLSNHDMNRVMSQLGNDTNLMKHAATVLLTIPGTPFIYYGEEIGMVGMKPDEQIRSPMQWNSMSEGGFSTGTPWEVPNFSFKKVNVEAQVTDESSLLSLYRNLINIRLNHSALIDGKYFKGKSSNPALYAGLQTNDSDYVLTIINLKNSIIDAPSIKFKSGLPVGKYTGLDLFDDGKAEQEIEVKIIGSDLEIDFSEPVAAHQNLILQLIPKE